MEITIKKQHEQTIKLPVPCYWKGYYRWIGLINDLQLVTFADYGDRCEVSMCLLSNLPNVWLEAAQDSDHFTIATEEEFFEAYDQAMKCLTVTPILKTW